MMAVVVLAYHLAVIDGSGRFQKSSRSQKAWLTSQDGATETATGFIYKKRKLDLTNIAPELLQKLNRQGLDIQDAIEWTKLRQFYRINKSGY